MTTTTASGAADLPEALRSIQRFEVVDCIDDKHVPAVIPNPHGPWVRYEDHIAALAAGQAAAAQQGVAYAALPEPLEIDWPELNCHALGCGVEDRGMYDRYDCAEYGWLDGVDKCADRVPEQIFDADQMRAFADATCALRASHGQAPASVLHLVHSAFAEIAMAFPKAFALHKVGIADTAVREALAAPATAQADSQPAPPPPPECETEAEKRAFAFGWFKALESERMKADSVQEDAARVFTYKNQPCDNVTAWRFGEACMAAQPGGDPIDHGLSLLQKLQERGYGIVAIDADRKQGTNHD